MPLPIFGPRFLGRLEGEYPPLLIFFLGPLFSEDRQGPPPDNPGEDNQNKLALGPSSHTPSLSITSDGFSGAAKFLSGKRKGGIVGSGGGEKIEDQVFEQHVSLADLVFSDF
jgi:hypothetical protein